MPCQTIVSQYFYSKCPPVLRLLSLSSRLPFGIQRNNQTASLMGEADLQGDLLCGHTKWYTDRQRQRQIMKSSTIYMLLSDRETNRELANVFLSFYWSKSQFGVDCFGSAGCRGFKKLQLEHILAVRIHHSRFLFVVPFSLDLILKMFSEGNSKFFQLQAHLFHLHYSRILEEIERCSCCCASFSFQGWSDSILAD